MESLDSRGHHMYPPPTDTPFVSYSIWFLTALVERGWEKGDGRNHNANSHHHCALQWVVLKQEPWQREGVFQLCHESNLLPMLHRGNCAHYSQYHLPPPTSAFPFPPLHMPHPSPATRKVWLKVISGKPHPITPAGLGVPLQPSTHSSLISGLPS